MAQRTSRLTGSLTPRLALRPAPTPPPDPPPAVEPPDRGRAAADFAGAAVLAVAALPVFFFCAVLVRITSRGPAIYTQTRVGRGGREFTLYKLRTMYRDSERYTGPKWCTPGDPRITPVGCVLRKLHLDELPQLWNVLKGDMSLIGPRPERPEIADRLRQSVRGYDRRHAVKPGITGFAQVHLPPDSCLRSVRNKLAYDLFYIRHRSARLTLAILAATGLKLVGLKSLYRRKPRNPTD